METGNILVILFVSAVFLLILFLPLQDSVLKKKKSELIGEINQFSKKIDSAKKENVRDLYIRMDNLVAKSLRLTFSNNESFGSNIKMMRSKFNRKSYDELWKAHIIRNRIVHEDYTPTTLELKIGYNVYRKAIYTILS